MAGDKDHMTMKKKCWKAYKNCLKGCSPQSSARGAKGKKISCQLFSAQTETKDPSEQGKNISFMVC